jgi:hypothetical protein
MFFIGDTLYSSKNSEKEFSEISQNDVNIYINNAEESLVTVSQAHIFE